MTMLSYSDPETKALLEERKRERDLEWLKGQIGDAAYTASLLGCGYSAQDANQELRLLQLDQIQNQKARRVI